MFKISVQEIIPTKISGLPDVQSGDVLVTKYEQSVESIDLLAIFRAVNRKPRRRSTKSKDAA